MRVAIWRNSFHYAIFLKEIWTPHTKFRNDVPNCHMMSGMMEWALDEVSEGFLLLNSRNCDQNLMEAEV